VIVIAFIAAVPLIGSATQDREDAGTAPVEKPSPQTEELLGVFKDAQTAEERAFAEDFVDHSAGEIPGLVPGENPALARRAELRKADIPGAGDAVFLWPSRDGACWSTEGVSSCATNGDIAKLGVLPAVTANRPGSESVTRVAGMAKDGVFGITVLLADGDSVETDVVRNTFLLEVTGTPVEIRWNEGGTVRTHPLPDIQPPAGGEIRDGLVRPQR
jgi:hypothetical protein